MPQKVWNGLHLLRQEVSDSLGCAVVGYSHQYDESGLPFDQGSDLRFVSFAENQIPFPKPGTARSSASFGRSLMLTMSGFRPRDLLARDGLIRLVLPVRNANCL